MTNYLTLVKLLIRYMFRRDKSKKSSRWIAVLYAFLGLTYVLVAAFVVFMIRLYSSVFVANGLLDEFVTLILIAGLAFVLIFGVISMLSTLYFSRDTEFFIALPVKPGTIYMAKLTVIFLTELITSSLFLIPCLVTVGVVNALPALYYVTMFFAVLLTPAIPLFLASVLAIPLMYLVSFFRNRGALSSIAVILLFGLFFLVYYVVIFRFMDSGEGVGQPELSEGMKQGFIAVANVFYPLYALSKFASGTPYAGIGAAGSMAANLAIFLGTVAVLGALALLISNAVYRRGAVSQLEGARSKRTAAAEYSVSGAFKALVKKEWRELLRTPSFAFQCLSGSLLCPILVVVLNVMNRSTVAMDPAVAETFATMMFWVTVGMISMMGIGMNIGASTSITREGDKFYYMKLMPVPYRVQIRAKAFTYTLISSFTVVLSSVINAFFHFNVWMLLCSVLFLLIYNYGYVNFAILFDLTKPKLDWVTPNEATKNSRNATVPLLMNMAVSVFFIAVPVVLSVLLSGWVGTLISWAVLFALALAAAFIFHTLLYGKCDKLLKQLSR